MERQVMLLGGATTLCKTKRVKQTVLAAKASQDHGTIQTAASPRMAIGLRTIWPLEKVLIMQNSFQSIRGLGPAIKLCPNPLNRHFAIVVAIGLLCSACSRSVFVWRYDEVSRVTSPDHQAEATILTGDGGATTATTTFVVIGTPGQQIDTNNFQETDAVFRADHLKGLRVYWKQPHLLLIQYDEARISGFNNLWDVLGDRQESYAVEIRLAPTSSDFSVPAADRASFPVK